MRSRQFAYMLTVLVGLALATTVARADKHQPTEGQPLLLEDHMGEMNRALRRLKRLLADPEKTEESLVLVATIQQHALPAKAMVPTMAQDVEPAKRKAFVTAYRRQMIGLVQALLTLEDQLLSGQGQLALETYGNIRRIQKEGHHSFRKKEE